MTHASNGGQPKLVAAEDLLSFGLRNYHQRMSILDFMHLVEAAFPGHKNKKRPARVTLVLPDHIVRALAGGDDAGVMLLCHVPKDVVERFLSPVQLSGER